MNTEAAKTCPNCHEPIPDEAPQGLCPKCLLAAASIATEAGQTREAAGVPSIESIAAVFPQLEIIEFIGQGGMGLVFKARQPKLDRLVALKLLPHKPGSDPSFCERFNREARVLARLSHPNIVAVHDFGEAGPFFYLLMEFVDGVNLRQALRAGRFSAAQALAVVPKICDALQYAHEEGVLHRDIKPENLLLDTRGRVKIADFGIAKLLGETKDITLTAKGGAIGTPHYMAPEQLERPHDVDQRADIYSLGVVFYEMLTGELPIGRFAPPSEKAPMDPRVDQVVLRTLEKERERRFPSAGEVKTRVEQITATSSASGPEQKSSPNHPGVKQMQAPPVIPAGAQDQTKHGISSRWSRLTILAAVLVGLSLFMLIPAFVVGMRSGPNELLLLCVLVGFPAFTGTALAWAALLRFRTRAERRGGRLALLAAMVWPVALASLLVVLLVVQCEISFQSHLFHVHSKGLAFVALLAGILSVLTLDFFVVRRCLRLWNATRTLPHEEVRELWRSLPRRVVWGAIAGFTILALGFLFMPRRSSPLNEPEPTLAAVQMPNVPPEYEVGFGGLPGNDDRLFRSIVTVPPGYVLTLAPFFLSNQVPFKPLLPNNSAALIVPEGQPVQAQLTWRLLARTTLADGAPLQFTLSLVGPHRGEKSFNLVTPEPVSIDWVIEPPQLWPPQNGHTKFLLMKGSSSPSPTQGFAPEEWAVAIDARLDPLPENLPDKSSAPQVILGTNWAPGVFKDGSPPNALPKTPLEAALASRSENLVQYLQACANVEKLAAREKELLIQFTPENPWVKAVQEELAAQQELKRQLEAENPSLSRIHKPQPEADISSIQR